MVRTQGADGWTRYASHSPELCLYVELASGFPTTASRLPRIHAGNPGVGWITLRLPVFSSWALPADRSSPRGVPHHTLIPANRLVDDCCISDNKTKLHIFVNPFLAPQFTRRRFDLFRSISADARSYLT